MQALLLDLDGTIIHSDPVHAAVFVDLLAERGRKVDTAFYFSNIHGRQNADIFAELLPDADSAEMSDLKEARYRARIAEVTPIAGVKEVIARVKSAGWHVGMVTNAPRPNAEAALDAFGLRGLFDTIVLGDECARGKPDPLPYATALANLGAEAGLSLAVEDSPAGLRSAQGAGLYTFGVTSGLDRAALLAAGADDTIEDFNAPALHAMLERLIGACA